MTNENLSPYVVITREQLETLLILANVADLSFRALDCEGTPLNDVDYKECCNIDMTDDESSEILVNRLLDDLDITHDVDYRSAIKNRKLVV